LTQTVSPGLLILLAIVLVVVVVFVLVRFGDQPLDLLDLNQEQRMASRMEAESDDMREMVELMNRDRRAAGMPELTEDELRYGPGR